MVLTANKDYWGDKPKWDKVTYRPMSNDAARWPHCSLATST